MTRCGGPGRGRVRLDPSRHVLELPGAEELRYDGLVIATGVESRSTAGVPWHDSRVHALERHLMPVPDRVAAEPSGPAPGPARHGVDGTIQRFRATDADILARLDREFGPLRGDQWADMGFRAT